MLKITTVEKNIYGDNKPKTDYLIEDKIVALESNEFELRNKQWYGLNIVYDDNKKFEYVFSTAEERDRLLNTILPALGQFHPDETTSFEEN